MFLGGGRGGLAVWIIFHYQIINFWRLQSIQGMLAPPNKAQHDKNDQDDRILEEYMRMKPSRAIDRLLSEYSIEKGFHLYNLLQEKIKRNTAQLRSTLTEKYENLVDCSNLLNKIKAFTDEIEGIQKNISRVFNQDPRLEEQDPNSRKRSVVNIIEQRIYQKKYHVAMVMTVEDHKNIDETDKMYMSMLKIQILSCLEEEIINRKFSKSFIAQIIECLKAFITHLTIKEKSQIIDNERKEGELLSLIAQTIESKEALEGIVDNDIIQIIFKCKLLSLHRKRHQQIKQQDNISKFFHDVFQLITEKQQDSQEISHLSAIFCKNLQQIEAHLLQTFIIKDKQKTITFRYELYQKLATSQDFIEILEKLYKVISESYGDAPKTTLKESFMNLWENYYNQLINLLFNRCNPIHFLPSLVTDKHKYARELSKYICSDDLSIESRIRSYQAQLQFFFTNVNKLIKETNRLKSSKWNSHEIIEQILHLYASKVQQLNTLIANYAQEISVQPSLNKLGSLIFLFLFCDEFNTRLSAYSQQKQLEQLKRIRLYEIRSNYRITKKFYPSFYDKSQKQSKWSVNFDHFFMKYYNPLLKQSKKQLIKSIILILLEGTMEGIDKDKTTTFIQQKTAKRQQQQKESQQKRNKLSDLPVQEVKPTTFAKKKYAQQSQPPRNGG